MDHIFRRAERKRNSVMSQIQQTEEPIDNSVYITLVECCELIADGLSELFGIKYADNTLSQKLSNLDRFISIPGTVKFLLSGEYDNVSMYSMPYSSLTAEKLAGCGKDFILFAAGIIPDCGGRRMAMVHGLVTTHSDHDLYEAILYQDIGKTELVEEVRPLVEPLRYVLDKRKEIRKAGYPIFLNFGLTACNTSAF